MAYAPDLSQLLAAGARYADEHDEYVIEPHPLGDVAFPTGQVVGCDPLTADDAEPFTVRVAALQLVVRDEPAVRWQPAVVAGNETSTSRLSYPSGRYRAPLARSPTSHRGRT